MTVFVPAEAGGTILPQAIARTLDFSKALVTFFVPAEVGGVTLPQAIARTLDFSKALVTFFVPAEAIEIARQLIDRKSNAV